MTLFAFRLAAIGALLAFLGIKSAGHSVVEGLVGAIIVAAALLIFGRASGEDILKSLERASIRLS